jgi:hypothetical protein
MLNQSLYSPLTAAFPRIAEKILIFVTTEPHNPYCKLIRVLFYDDDIACLSSFAIPLCTKEYDYSLFCATLAAHYIFYTFFFRGT